VRFRKVFVVLAGLVAMVSASAGGQEVSSRASASADPRFVVFEGFLRLT
jgi:hypothetical protein